MVVTFDVMHFWPLILFIGGLAFHAISMHINLAATIKKAKEHDDRIHAQEERAHTQDTMMAEIRNDLRWIREKLDESDNVRKR